MNSNSKSRYVDRIDEPQITHAFSFLQTATPWLQFANGAQCVKKLRLRWPAKRYTYADQTSVPYASSPITALCACAVA